MQKYGRGLNWLYLKIIEEITSIIKTLDSWENEYDIYM